MSLTNNSYEGYREQRMDVIAWMRYGTWLIHPSGNLSTFIILYTQIQSQMAESLSLDEWSQPNNLHMTEGAQPDPEQTALNIWLIM